MDLRLPSLQQQTESLPPAVSSSTPQDKGYFPRASRAHSGGGEREIPHSPARKRRKSLEYRRMGRVKELMQMPNFEVFASLAYGSGEVVDPSGKKRIQRLGNSTGEELYRLSSEVERLSAMRLLNSDASSLGQERVVNKRPYILMPDLKGGERMDHVVQPISRLGEGKFGQVDLTYLFEEKRYAAMKSAMGHRKESVLSIDNEFIILKKINSCGILPGLQEAPYRYFRFMGPYGNIKVGVTGPLYDGDLKNLLSFHRFSPREVIKIFSSVVEGMNHLHNKQIVHRDIKMDNLFFKKEEERYSLRIGDFGLAQDLRSKDLILSAPLFNLQFHYVEDIRAVHEVVMRRKKLRGRSLYGKQEYSNRCKAIDVFSLGITQFYSLTNVYRFVYRDLKEWYKGRYCDYRAKLDLLEGISDEARTLVYKMTDLSHAQRPTAKELVQLWKELPEMRDLSSQKF